MGRYIAVAQIFTVLLMLASSVRLEKLADGKYRVEAIFAATNGIPRQAITTLFTSKSQAEAAYWHYLLKETPLATLLGKDTRLPSSAR